MEAKLVPKVHRDPKKRYQKRAAKNDAKKTKKSSKNGPQDAPTGRQEEPFGEHLGALGLPKRVPEGRLAPSRAPRIS